MPSAAADGEVKGREVSFFREALDKLLVKRRVRLECEHAESGIQKGLRGISGIRAHIDGNIALQVGRQVPEQKQFRLPAHLTIRELVEARRPLQLADLLSQFVDFREGFLQLLHAATPFNGLLEIARLLGKRGLDMAQKNLRCLELLF